MNEKEKKAVKELTEIKNLVEEDLKDSKLQATAILDEIDLESLVIVLDLVKKLEKEIENLNREMTDFSDMWLHKDKIRKLIDEINREYANRAYTAEDMIDVLKELL